MNTSSNDIIRRFIRMAKGTTKREIEQLMEGRAVERTVRQELTYKELCDSIDNLWSVLYTTGYLTHRGKPEGKKRRHWDVSSNRKSGDGYSDILVEIEDENVGIVIEVKYAEDGDLEAACREALEQIETMRYEEQFWEWGYDHVLKYGIACYKKRCRVEKIL